jgi:hypothetical protein
MLIGYVSDEMYVAVSNAQIEFLSENFQVEVRSTASGAIYADIPIGEYTVVLDHSNFGRKTSLVTIKPDMQLMQSRP